MRNMEQREWWVGGKGRGEEEVCLGAFSDPIHLQITSALDEKFIPPPTPPPPPKRNAPNGVNELPEVCFEFPVSLIGKSTIAFFLIGQSWCVLKSWYTDGAQNKDFGADSQTDLTRV